MELRMQSVFRFLVGLLMPVVLIGSGGALTGWAITNNWSILAWIGLAFIAAGVIWGLFLFFWADAGTW